MFKTIKSSSTFRAIGEETTNDSVTPEILERLDRFAADIKREKLQDLPELFLNATDGETLKKQGFLSLKSSDDFMPGCFYQFNQSVLYVDKTEQGQLVLKKFEG